LARVTTRRPPTSTPFPYTTLFRSRQLRDDRPGIAGRAVRDRVPAQLALRDDRARRTGAGPVAPRARDRLADRGGGAVRTPGRAAVPQARDEVGTGAGKEAAVLAACGRAWSKLGRDLPSSQRKLGSCAPKVRQAA